MDKVAHMGVIREAVGRASGLGWAAGALFRMFLIMPGIGTRLSFLPYPLHNFPLCFAGNGGKCLSTPRHKSGADKCIRLVTMRNTSSDHALLLFFNHWHSSPAFLLKVLGFI